MHRTTILLPEKLKKCVNSRARTLGLSLGEFVRKSLESSLKKDFIDLKNDLFVQDNNFYSEDIEINVSAKHDDYIYGDKK